MEGYDQDGRYLQELRLHSLGDTLSIPTTLTIPARWDAEVEHPIILLSDVQLVFKNARRFLDNGVSVPFIKDHDSQELIPLRIKYRHEVTLDLLEVNAEESSVFYMESPLLAHINHCEPCVEDMASSQERDMLRFQIMEQLLKSMDREIFEDRNQLLRMSELVHDLGTGEQEDKQIQSNKQKKEQHMLEKQQQILQAQQRNINRLSTIQENVQDSTAVALMAQERPFHHLFVALPSGYDSGSYGGFRLFFLCEHGHQSTSRDRAPLPNIHIARHEGYELQNLDEFFQDYSPYLVSIFHILKNGIDSPGFNIPRLSHMTLAEGVVEVQDILNLSNNTIQSLINETISYIHDHRYNSMMDSRLALGVIESTDPRSVLRYLKSYKRNGHTLGNLCQTITSEKDVKWVCADHYHEKYRDIVEEEGQEKTDEADNDEEIHSVDVGGQDELAEATLLDGFNSMKRTDKDRTVIAFETQVEQDDTVLQALIRAVADKDDNVREVAVRALRGPSRTSRSALEAVIRAAIDDKWNVQEAAVQGLGDQLHLSKDMTTALVAATRSNHLHVQGAAINALIKHVSSETVLQYLIEIIRGDDHMEKAAAIEVLATQTKLPGAAVEVLISILGDYDKDIRNSAVNALQSQNEFSGSDCQKLLEKVQDNVSHVREAAIRVLGNQISVFQSITTVLIASLQDESSDVQAAAIQVLGDKSDLPQATVQELTSALYHERVSVRKAAARVLGGQDALSETTIQALTATLKDKAPSVREVAVQALGSQVQQSQLVIDTLVGMLVDSDPKVRGAAVYSLGRKTKLPDSTVQVLIKTLDDRDMDVQEKAIQVLGGQAASSTKVVKALLRFLRNKNHAVRNSTIDALSSDVQLSDATIQKLTKNLQDEHHHVRAATVRVLSNHAKWSGSAAEALTNAVLGEDVALRRWAANALNKIKLPEAAVLTLTTSIKGNNQLVKLDVIRVLGNQVNTSEAAVEALICSLCDLHIQVRRSAKEALSGLTRLPEYSVPAFERVLSKRDTDIRISALNGLSDHIRSCEAAALVTLRSLRDKDQRVKDTALQALRKNGLPESTQLVLIEGLKSRDRTAVDETFNILNGLPSMSGNAVRKLIECLRYGDKGEIRRDAVRLLAKQVEWSEAAAKALTKALKDVFVRLEAWIALDKVTKFTQSMIQDLIDALQDNNIMVSQAARSLLERQNSLPGYAIMALVSALKNQRDHIRTGARIVLQLQAKLPESATQALTDYLRENDPTHFSPSRSHSHGMTSSAPTSPATSEFGASDQMSRLISSSSHDSNRGNSGSGVEFRGARTQPQSSSIGTEYLTSMDSPCMPRGGLSVDEMLHLMAGGFQNEPQVATWNKETATETRYKTSSVPPVGERNHP